MIIIIISIIVVAGAAATAASVATAAVGSWGRLGAELRAHSGFRSGASELMFTQGIRLGHRLHLGV